MHISHHDLERYHLRTVYGAELDTIEAHVLCCGECADRAVDVGEYIDAMRAAMVRMKPETSSTGP